MIERANKPRRAAFFFVEGWLSIAPSVLSAAIRLSQHGYDVDLFYVRSLIPVLPPTLPRTVRLVEYVPSGLDLVRVLRQFFPRLGTRDYNGPCNGPCNAVSHEATDPLIRVWARSLAQVILNVSTTISKFIGFGLFCRRQIQNVDLAIAFDMTGLAVMTIAVPRKVPFIYWSLEITLRSEARGLAARALKWTETRWLPKARAIVAQDRKRADLLAKDSDFDKGKLTIVPNSPPFPRQENLPEDFFIQRCGIPPTATIVLHAGIIAPVVCSREIATAAALWPENFVLVFHERSKISPSDPYLRAVQAASGPRVFFSLDPVPFEMVDTVYAGAKIGIVCYEPIDANWATTLLASGKLIYYLRNGLPVVIVASTTPWLLDGWKCGVCVLNISEIGEALAVIAADYTLYSEQAKQCYDEIFDFGRAFDRLMAVVEAC